MGRLVSGLLGPVVGRVGPVVGSSRNGRPYIKAKYKKRTKRVSKKELANRKKFAVAQAWLRPLLDFVRVGFKGYSEKSQGFVAAKSWLLKNALEAEDGQIRINPAKMKVSAGNLPLSANIAVSKIGEDILQFTWDGSEVKDGNGNDQVMILAYNVESRDAIFKAAGQFRSTGSDELPVGGDKEKPYQLYLAFVSVDREKQSDSVYLGEMML